MRALAAGQEASAEDIAALDLAVIAETLAGRRIVDVRSEVLTNSIDDRYFLPLARFAAAKYGGYYGLSMAEADALEARAVREFDEIVNAVKPMQIAIPDRF